MCFTPQVSQVKKTGVISLTPPPQKKTEHPNQNTPLKPGKPVMSLCSYRNTFKSGVTFTLKFSCNISKSTKLQTKTNTHVGIHSFLRSPNCSEF